MTEESTTVSDHYAEIQPINETGQSKPEFKPDQKTIEHFETRVDEIVNSGSKGLSDIKDRVGASEQDFQEAIRQTNANIQLAGIGIKAKDLVRSFREKLLEQDARVFVRDQVEQGRTPGAFREKFGDGFASDVLKTSAETPEERRVERQRNLRDFREGFAQNQLDLVRTIRQIESQLVANPNLDISSITLDRPGLKDEQAIEIYTRLRNFEARREAIREVTQDSSAEQVYKKLFGVTPKGAVGLEHTPVSIYMRISDDDDYAVAYSNGVSYQTEETTSMASQTAGAMLWSVSLEGIELSEADRVRLQQGLSGAITIERSSFVKNKADSEATKTHETQHAIHALMNRDDFRKVPEIIQGRSLEDFRGSFQNYLEQYRTAIYDPKAKNEMLAFFSDGHAPEDTYNILTKPNMFGGIYDYQFGNEDLHHTNYKVREQMREGFGISESEVADYTGSAYRTVFFERYRERLAQSANVLWNLYENRHFLISPTADKRDVVDILSIHPMDRWPRLYKTLQERSGLPEKDLRWQTFVGPIRKSAA